MKTTSFSRLKRILLWTFVALFAIGLYLAFGAWRLREADESFHHELNKSLIVKSTTFENGGDFPIRCTCEGGETRPALSVGSVPEGTRSLVAVMVDPDAPAPWLKLFFFMHWVVIDLPPNLSLGEGPAMTPPYIGQVMANSMGKKGYIGPCPPIGRHSYPLRVYALAVPTLGIDNDISYTELLDAMRGKVLGYGERVGYYEK